MPPKPTARMVTFLTKQTRTNLLSCTRIVHLFKGIAVRVMQQYNAIERKNNEYRNRSRGSG